MLDHLRADSQGTTGSTSDYDATNTPTTPGSEPGRLLRIAEEQSSVHRPRPTSAGHELSQPMPSDHPVITADQARPHEQHILTSPFLSFGDFTQNVLANNSYFSYEPVGGTPGLIDRTPAISTTTLWRDVDSLDPLAGLAATPSLTDAAERYETTPLIERGVELFFSHLYPIYPFLSREATLRWLANPRTLTKSQKTLIWSISALSMVAVDDWADLGSEQRIAFSRQSIRKCQQLRVGWDFAEESCFEDVLTSLFIGVAYFDFKCRKASWTFVREAIALATAAGLHDPATYSQWSAEEQVHRRRAYAILYITERGAAIMDFFPVSILVPPVLSTSTLPAEDPSVGPSLSALHQLFSLLDLKFVRLWNDPSHTAFGGSIYADLHMLQDHLRELKFDERPLSDIQRADVLITQQWLRLIFWQAALRQGLISSIADNIVFGYDYPIAIAMDLQAVVRTLTPVAIQVHGLGIFEKQFEVAYSLMDALAHSKIAQPEHYECLRFLLLSLSASPSSRQIYVKTLENKMSGPQKYRNLSGVELLRDESRQSSRRQSTAVGASDRTARPER